jgi:hypothetical protein
MVWYAGWLLAETEVRWSRVSFEIPRFLKCRKGVIPFRAEQMSLILTNERDEVRAKLKASER